MRRRWDKNGVIGGNPFQNSGSDIRAPDNRSIRSVQCTRNPGVSIQQLLTKMKLKGPLGEERAEGSEPWHEYDPGTYGEAG